MHFPSLLANFHSVTPEVVRCAQPFTKGHWRALLRRHGIKTVINLRGENPNAYWYQDEKAVCAAFGVRHLDIMLSSKRLPSRAALKTVLDALETEPKPILIKCSGGSDRTGLVAGVHILDKNGSFAQARAHLRLFPYIHKPKAQQRWIKAFWDYVEATRERSMSLRDWVEAVYTDEAFAAWLKAQGKDGFWRKDAV